MASKRQPIVIVMPIVKAAKQSRVRGLERLPTTLDRDIDSLLPQNWRPKNSSEQPARSKVS
jgi:hypothetical protein